jgi:5'-AMP-activated protein kinase regulatory beta subunit
LKPGTHRLKFIVDGEWKCSPDLETALDISGNLVNYIEVKVEDLEKEVLQEIIVKKIVENDDDTLYTQNIPDYLLSNEVTNNSATPQVNDPYIQSMTPYIPSYGSSYYSTPSVGPVLTPPSTDNPLNEQPPLLPPYLERIVLNSNNMTSRNSEDRCPKDDPIVLSSPNHVCINHIYALSIRDGVMGLASSRRYKNKYCTTVLYRPVK